MRYFSNFKPITIKEQEILDKLWERDEMTAREVMDAFPEPRPHINTISTFLRVLENKGWVKHRPIGTTNLYRAACSKEEMGHKTVKNVVSQFFNGSMMSLINSFLQAEDLSPEELGELKKLVSKKTRKK